MRSERALLLAALVVAASACVPPAPLPGTTRDLPGAQDGAPTSSAAATALDDDEAGGDALDAQLEAVGAALEPGGDEPASGAQAVPPAAVDWRAPVVGRITDRFGPRADGSMHEAVDIAVPRATEVLAPADGRVSYIAYQTRAGRFVMFDLRRPDGSFDGDGWRFTFAHLSHTAVFEGQTVLRGEPVGTVGISGSSTGPHLHLRIEQVKVVDGKTTYTAVDPLTVLPESALVAP